MEIVRDRVKAALIEHFATSCLLPHKNLVVNIAYSSLEKEHRIVRWQSVAVFLNDLAQANVSLAQGGAHDTAFFFVAGPCSIMRSWIEHAQSEKDISSHGMLCSTDNW